jgi:hypothetical protein
VKGANEALEQNHTHFFLVENDQSEWGHELEYEESKGEERDRRETWRGKRSVDICYQFSIEFGRLLQPHEECSDSASSGWWDYLDV